MEQTNNTTTNQSHSLHVAPLQSSSLVSTVVNICTDFIKMLISLILAPLNALIPKWKHSGFIIPKARMTMILEFPVMN